MSKDASLSTGKLPRALWIVGYALLVVLIAVFAHQKPDWPYFVAAMMGAGLVHFVLWWRGGWSTRHVVLGALLFRLVFVGMPPVLSDDAYRYVWDGWIQAEGYNPYLVKPSDAKLQALQAEPVYPLLNSEDYYSVYPPVSQLVFLAGTSIGRDGWLAGFYGIKGLLMLLEFAGVLLLARMVPARSLLLYAWHPLVLVEVAGQAHTEAAMVIFLVAAFWFARRGIGTGAAAAVVAAGMVKLYPFFVLPLVWRRFGWRSVAASVVAGVVLALPYAHPAVPFNVAESLDLYVRYFEFNAGPYYALKGLFRLITGDDWSKTLGPALRLVFFLTLPVLYALDWKQRWPFPRGVLYVIGAFFLLTTTIHPWYVIGILVVLPFLDTLPRPWYWVSIAASGTYLHYIDGPYWTFVWLCWGGAFVLWVVQYRDGILTRLLRARAWLKYRRLRRVLGPANGTRMLDLGAGEGYVGDWFARLEGAGVILADVVDMNRTALPHIRYDGVQLPFAAGAFDTVVLAYVLHHCAQPEAVLAEALRVARREVVILESVYETATDERILRWLDVRANRWRSGGRMAAQEEHLRFRTAAAWERMARRLARESRHPGRVEATTFGRFPHKQVHLHVRFAGA